MVNNQYQKYHVCRKIFMMETVKLVYKQHSFFFYIRNNTVVICYRFFFILKYHFVFKDKYYHFSLLKRNDNIYL